MKLFAFLRAINVGGRNVKMADLKKIFESMGFKNVETYIASGNVVFEGRGPRSEVLERKIAATLLAKLKYDHDPFVRTLAELHAIVKYEPFSAVAVAKAPTYQVGLAGAIEAAAKKRIQALSSDVDDFRVRGSEIYWLSQIALNESKITQAMYRRAIGGPVTWRNVRTLRAMAEKYPLG